MLCKQVPTLALFTFRNLTNQKHRLTYARCHHALVYNEFGDPGKVLSMKEMNNIGKSIGPTEVLAKVLMAPVNPADINMIQGTYSIKPQLPAIAGNEAISEIVEVGPEVNKLKVGSWVIQKVPAAGHGLWTEIIKCEEHELFEVPNDLPVLSAATMAVNPCTAYRMLKDFVRLEKNDTVIQNASNSAVGLAVIQIARILGVNTVNIVRSRDNDEELKTRLRSLGATHVVTDKDLKSNYVKEIFSDIPKAKLALNAVGGKSTVDLCKYMAPSSTMVTYGGMSRQPLMVPVGSLIFNDIKVEGYWMTRWVQNNSDDLERTNMMNHIYEMIRSDLLLPPSVTYHKFKDFKVAVSDSMKPFIGKKQILVMDNKYLKT